MIYAEAAKIAMKNIANNYQQLFKQFQTQVLPKLRTQQPLADADLALSEKLKKESEGIQASADFEQLKSAAEQVIAAMSKFAAQLVPVSNPIAEEELGPQAVSFQFPVESKKEYERKYPMFSKFLKSNLKDLLKSKKIVASLIKYSNNQLTEAQIHKDFTDGQGPTLIIMNMDKIGTNPDGTLSGGNIRAEGKFFGYNQHTKRFEIQLSEQMILSFEQAMANPKSAIKAREAILLGISSTLLHEYVHYGDRDNDYDETGPNDNIEFEEGVAFEESIYPGGISPARMGDTREIEVIVQQINKLRTGKYNPADKTEVLETQWIDLDAIPTLPVKDDIPKSLPPKPKNTKK